LTVAPPSGDDVAPRQAGRTAGFRPDIEGLRAVAIVAVLACHAGIPFLAGGYVGVDVFFVISGFLITGLLLREVERTGGVSLRGFYARRIRRLLPLAAVLLVAVAILSLALFSPVRAVEVSGDIVSSAFYAANWHFAAQSVDYFAQDAEPSPVQHLWSLAVEEQFYLVWPSLLLAVTWIWRRRGASIRPVLWVTLAIVGFGSLAYGVHLTGSSPSLAYFSTLDRAWELALGAALALVGAPRLPRFAAAALGWLGLGAIVCATLAYTAGTPFPGTAALLPTLGAACLILAGSSPGGVGRAGPTVLLSPAPVRYVGRISYSWYLWHWPALVFAVAIWGPLSPAAGIAVIAASWFPTALTHRLIEQPFHHARSLVRIPNRALALGLACTVLAAGAGVLLSDLQPSLRAAPLDQVEGASILAEEPALQEQATAVRPSPLQAAADKSRLYYEGCLVGIPGTHSNRCLYGDPDGKRTLILFGDSHAMQFFPPLLALAEEHHWRLIALTKAECPPAKVAVISKITGHEYSQCEAWRQESLRHRIAQSGKHAIVVMSSETDYTPLSSDGRELTGTAANAAMEDGYVTTLRRIRGLGLGTVVIKDTPRSPRDVPSCVSEHLDDLRACAFREVEDEADDFESRAVERVPGAHLIDINDKICPTENLCRAVIGNALVYQDNSHLTATFARSLGPWIAHGLEEAGI
jgi:peptidoglycan/LPS O-acetylase OafA/YrhL